MDLVINFSEVKVSIRNVIDYISKNKDDNITDASFQIKKINTTINELKKNSIPVPNELTSLKLSLSSKIDKVKDCEKIRKDLIEYLVLCISELNESAPDKPIKKEKVKKITILERVNLKDLINANILQPNIEFYAYYKSNRFSAILLNDGSLEMLNKKKKKNFENPRAAAVAITGYQIDAWKFWKLDFEGKPLSLDDYRKKYFKKKQKEDNNNTNIATTTGDAIKPATEI